MPFWLRCSPWDLLTDSVCYGNLYVMALFRRLLMSTISWVLAGVVGAWVVAGVPSRITCLILSCVGILFSISILVLLRFDSCFLAIAACDLLWPSINHCPHVPQLLLPCLQGRLRLIYSGQLGLQHSLNVWLVFPTLDALVSVCISCAIFCTLKPSLVLLASSDNSTSLWQYFRLRPGIAMSLLTRSVI